MPTRNVNLTDHFDQFVQDQISEGSYRNASEVMRAGLRLLQEEKRQRQEKVKLLRRLAKDGFASIDRGKGIEIGSDEELDAFFQNLRQKPHRTGRGRGKQV